MFFMKKTLLFLLTAALLLAGCGAKENTAEDVSAAPTPAVLSAKTFKAEEQYVKHMGRTEMYQDTLWLAQSASGVEFTFTGTSASITMASDSTMMSGGAANRARFAVYVNGERVLDKQIKKMLETYEIFASEEAVETTVQIVKLSEAANSTVGIRSIDVTCYGDIQPTAQKELKIEFIGDSITCGYGVDDEDPNHHFSTATEDATKTYAYKTAVALDADYSFVAYSGHGIISGYTSNGERVTEQLVPDMYHLSAKTAGGVGDFSFSNTEWDFSRFVPDFVVVNLGTNDNSYVGSDKAKRQMYVDEYVEFLKVIREKNSEAHIVCTLGIMGDQLYSAVEEAVENYQSQTSDTKVSAFRFKPHNGSTGYAADWHPTEATHELAAEALAAEIKKLQRE